MVTIIQKILPRREATFRVKNHLAITWFRSEWVKHHVVQPQCDKICVRFITFDLLDSETEIGSLIPISLLKNWKALLLSSMSQENTVLDACLFRVRKLVRLQSQMHLSKICQVQAPVVQKVDIFVPQRRPAPIVLLSRSSYTKEFTCKLDCSSYLSGYCTRDHESSDRCWPPLGIKIYFIPNQRQPLEWVVEPCR